MQQAAGGPTGWGQRGPVGPPRLVNQNNFYNYDAENPGRNFENPRGKILKINIFGGIFGPRFENSLSHSKYEFSVSPSMFKISSEFSKRVSNFLENKKVKIFKESDEFRYLNFICTLKYHIVFFKTIHWNVMNTSVYFQSFVWNFKTSMLFKMKQNPGSVSQFFKKFKFVKNYVFEKNKTTVMKIKNVRKKWRQKLFENFGIGREVGEQALN